MSSDRPTYLKICWGLAVAWARAGNESGEFLTLDYKRIPMERNTLPHRLTRLAGILPVILLCLGCGGSRPGAPEFPFDRTWELEYISGPRIAFEGLFPERRPNLVFTREGKVSGNSGCNGYAAPVDISGGSITFGEAGPSTLMYCGPGENVFRDMLGKIDGWTVDAEGKLNLLLGDIPLMRFRPFAD